MKKIAICFFLVMLVLFISACSETKKVANQKNSPAKKKITLTHYFSGSLSGGILDMIRRFNENNSTYELSVTALDHEAFKTSILENLSKDNPPDLYTYWSGARVQSVVDKLMPIDKIWQEAELDKKFAPAIINSACSYNGKKYLLPITQHFVGIYYNKQIFTKLGLTPPKTWKEFLNICSVIKKNNITPISLGSKNQWPAQFWFDYLLLRTTPYEYREKLMNGQANYQDKEVVNVFKMWSEMISQGYFNQNPNNLDWDIGAGEEVFFGKAAMTLMGTWLISFYSDDKHKWKSGEDYGIFPFPTIDANIPLVSLGPIDGLVIPAKSQNVEGAMQVLAHFAREENQKAMSLGSGAFAPNINVPRSFYNSLQQEILNEIDKSKKWAFAYDLSAPPSAAEIGLNAFCEFLEFPKYYLRILAQTDEKIKKTFNKTPL